MKKVYEKYTRVGPSTRVKRSVAPVKILIASGTTKPHYRTYYAGNKKHENYSEHAIRDLASALQKPRYEQYLNKAKRVMTNNQLRPEFEQNMSGTWSRDHVEASGALYGYINKALRLDPNIKVAQKLSGHNKQALKLSDGTIIESRIDMHNLDNGDTSLSYTNKYGVGADVFESSLKATAKVVDGKRHLTINEINKYGKEDLGYFLTNARQKFDKISFDENSRIDDPGFSYDLMQLGFLPKENENSTANFESIKRQSKSEITTSDMTPKQKRQTEKALRNTTFSKFMVDILRQGNVGKVPSSIKSIINMYTTIDSSNSLTFDNTKKRSQSIQALHTTMLQLDVDNDFHKGLIRKGNKR